MNSQDWHPWRLENLLTGGERRNADLSAPQSLFQREVAMRPFRIMLDWDYLRQDHNARLLEYLLEFSSNELIEAYWYSRDDPPPHLQRISTPVAESAVEHWVVNLESRWSHVGEIVYGANETFTRVEFSLDDWRFRLVDSNTVKAFAVENGNDAQSIDQDTRAILSAEAIQADVFVTSRHYLLNHPYKLSNEVTILDLSATLPLVGLHSRLRGYYLIQKAKYIHERCSAWLFFRVAAQHLIPILRPFRHWCNKLAKQRSDDRYLFLIQSLQQRISWTLSSRDRLLGVLATPQQNQSQEDSVSLVTEISLWLMGALDASALLAHLIFGLRSNERFAGWQSTKWLVEVTHHRPQLSSLFETKSEGHNTLLIIREIRNCIHAEALGTMGYQRNGSPLESLVTLPPMKRPSIIEAMDLLGGRDKWGARSLQGNEVLLHPGVLIETLLPQAFDLIENVLALLLPNLDHIFEADNDSDSLSSLQPSRMLFSNAGGQRLLWQLGSNRMP